VHTPVLPAPSAFMKLLLELLDLGEEGGTIPRGRLLCEACRLLDADLLYKVTSQEGGWIKEGFDPQRELGSHPVSHVSGIVRHVLSKRARYLEASLPARGPFHRHQDGWAGIAVSSYLAVPIHRRGRTRGVLVLLRGPGRPPFTVDDLSRADLLADALAVGEDVAERIFEVERLARTDSVTHLPNLRHLREVLGRVILRAGNSDRPLSLVVVDADLTEITMRRGPLVTCEVLPRIARTLERSLRGTDFVAHHCGATFVILLPETTREGAECVVVRLSTILARESAVTGLTPSNACRWGIASYPADGTDASALLAGAARNLRLIEPGEGRLESDPALPGEGDPREEAA
jgi:diguanylate cyclase (GGDEF)-like protein